MSPNPPPSPPQRVQCFRMLYVTFFGIVPRVPHLYDRRLHLPCGRSRVLMSCSVPRGYACHVIHTEAPWHACLPPLVSHTEQLCLLSGHPTSNTSTWSRMQLISTPASAIAKDFTGTFDQEEVLSWHPVLLLGAGVEATARLVDTDIIKAIFHLEHPGANPTYNFYAVFLSLRSPASRVGKCKFLTAAPYRPEVRKLRPTEADATHAGATLRVGLSGVLPPPWPATSWQFINMAPA